MKRRKGTNRGAMTAKEMRERERTEFQKNTFLSYPEKELEKTPLMVNMQF